MSSSTTKVAFCLLVLVAVDAGLCKSLSGNGKEGFLVKLLDKSDDRDAYVVKYEVFAGEEEKAQRKPKNCVGVVTLMALCF